MSYTTIIKQDGTVTQDTVTSFTDGRIWKLATGECLRISDDKKIYKMGADGGKVAESPIINASVSDQITLAVNKEEDRAYVLYKSATDNGLHLATMLIGNCSFITDVEVGISSGIPLRAIISSYGDLMVLVRTSTSTVFVIDLDGTIVANGGAEYPVETFAITKENVIFYVEHYRSFGSSSQILHKLTFVPNSTSRTNISYKINNELFTYDMFTLNDFLYLLVKNSHSCSKIVKILVNTWNEYNTYMIKDITTDYGIDNNNICQFNASGFDNFGTFFGEKDGVMRRWQVDLDNLECTPARWETYPTKQVFSNDTNLSLVDYSGVNGNNCDNCGLITSSKGVTGSA